MSNRIVIEDYEGMAVRFGRAVYEARRAQGLKAEELANELDLSYASVRSYETGKRLPSTGHCVAIARLLGLSLDELLLPPAD